MITRIVKLTIQEHRVDDFLEMFSHSGPRIRAMHGCRKVELVQDLYHPFIFFTISHWETEADLEAYRKSQLFKDTWAVTKAMFMLPAKAWSTRETTL